MRAKLGSLSNGSSQDFDSWCVGSTPAGPVNERRIVMKLYELIVAELLAVVIAVILSDKNAYEKAHADLSQLIR